MAPRIYYIITLVESFFANLDQIFNNKIKFFRWIRRVI
jgi:hypothetical protein